MKGRVAILVLGVLLAGSSCRNSPGKSGEFTIVNADSLAASVNPEAEAVEEIYRNLSSPLEIANLFQVMGVPFSPGYLASAIDANEQTTSFQKALFLGILGADLGYLNMYEKTGTAIELVSSIKKLADGLNVGQYFNFETIKRVSLNKSNIDSLLFLYVDSYSRMDEYLRKNNRSQLSAIMVVGVWLEAQYFSTRVIKQYPNNLLRERIGEQKYFLDDLIKIIAPYCDYDSEFAEMCGLLKDIASKYENVKISYTKGEPSSSEKDGMLVVTQTESSMVEMTDEQLAQIIEITGIVRNKLISK
jgi:hypothetical protein